MGLWKVIQWNRRYIKTVNSCNLKTYTEMVDEMLELKGGFTSKWYIWNTIRGKNFYITISNYVANMVRDAMEDPPESELVDIMTKIHRTIDAVMSSESNEVIKRDFVRNLTKQVPLITLTILPYMSSERVKNILLGDRQVVHDDAFLPVVNVIAELRTQQHMSSDVVEDYDY